MGRLPLTLFFVLFSNCLSADEPTKTEMRGIVEAPISESDRDHWAFRPILRPTLPTLKTREWPTNEIDYFVLEKLETSNLRPATEADRLVFLRSLNESPNPQEESKLLVACLAIFNTSEFVYFD